MGEKQTKESSNIILAFRLGWSLSEFMGRARQAWARGQGAGKKSNRQIPKELQGFADDEAPRLTCSNRYFSTQGAWWQSAVRIVALADQLGVLDKEGNDIRKLPDRIYALTFGDNDETCSPRDFYDLLEPWSREVGTKLAAHSDSAARAFKVGGQIADTYWFMRSKEYFGEPRDKNKQDSWHQLLNHKRLTPIIEDVKIFEDDLPPLVGDCLRFSMYRWMIAHDLEYRRKRLILVRDKDKKDSSLPREKGGILEKIERGDEERIARRLARQAEIWQDLILGARAPEGYLRQQDRRRILCQAIVYYILRAVGMTVGLSLIGYALIAVLGGTASVFLTWLWDTLKPEQAQPDTLKTSIEIVTKTLPLVTGAIVFAASLLRDGWSETRGLWQRVLRAARERAIRKRTWISWRSTK